MTIEEIQKEIIEEFSLFDNWLDKYEHLIEIGKSMSVMSQEHKTDDNIIKGCQSRVWLYAHIKDDKVYFSADSDTVITKGLIALMLRVFNGQDPLLIAQSNTDFIDEIGLKEHLTPTRSNGLLVMIKQIKFYAIALKTKMKN
ncbi:SufE family protein [Ichthyobacterium seriolicida]|uniref:Fe-S metabolism protein SufE n=1 Tax=Ichthyobacterium seriolicida TaxID=242600 RepID=A0A1J1E9U3_9FLAO|nr:SufE family protein [Ichthyobacterium seriolicida]BAV94296.1 Fe-S metabolism protein SufE [Ichthyobacterium seriolicida]